MSNMCCVQCSQKVAAWGGKQQQQRNVRRCSPWLVGGGSVPALRSLVRSSVARLAVALRQLRRVQCSLKLPVSGPDRGAARATASQ